MDLNTQNWKEFNLSKLCKIEMGNKFDNDKMTHDNPCVNFVSRTGENNGVSDVVDEVRGVKPYPANSISVALGGSIGSCFLQTKPFYTGQNVAVLLFDNVASNEVKLFITTMFMNECKYKYVAFGRELNVHIRKDFTFFLPIQHNMNDLPVISADKKYSEDGYVPDWMFMEKYIKSLHSNPITTQITGEHIPYLEIDKWEEFRVSDLFSQIYKAKAHTKDEVEVLKMDRGIHYVSRTDTNNGVHFVVKNEGLQGVEKANCITIGDTTATCYYQNEDFVTGDHIVVLRAEWMNLYRGLFVRTIFMQEYIRYCYGRAYRMDLIKNTIMKLPIQRDDKGEPIIDVNKNYSIKGYVPDWDFMENYMKMLPYSDRI